jgi:hypothetical protein
VSYANLLERQRRNLIWISDALIDNNPLWLLRLPDVHAGNLNEILVELIAIFDTIPRPIYYEQIYNLLAEHNKLHLIGA